MAYNNQQNNQQQGGRPMTTTHIRTLFSPGTSSMTIKFFNTNLSIQLMPFSGKDARGRDNYDKNRSSMTTINFEGAAALQMFADDIIAGKVTGDSARQEVQCNQAVLSMTWTKAAQGPNVTELTLNKNGQNISFAFASSMRAVMKAGQPTMEPVETGLKAFSSIMAGYLTGINADRHLDKLTEDFAKSQEAKAAAGGGWTGGGGGYQKPGNSAGGFTPTAPAPQGTDFGQFAVQG